MNSNESLRNYHLTDSELSAYSLKLCNALTRDQADLAEFGITTAKITTLKADATAFANFPTDEYYLADIINATEAKKALETIVRDKIRKMATRVAVKWGDKSGNYRRLSVVGLSGYSEDKLITIARTTHTAMTDYLPDLAEYGLTQILLDEFQESIDALQDAIAEQLKAVATRRNKAVERAEKGNSLYKLVAGYSEIGKREYVHSSPAQYNDFVIYSPSAGPLLAPTGLAFNWYYRKLAWNAVENATSYQLERSLDGINFTVIYTGADIFFIYTPPEEGWAYYRVRARNNNGFGPYSEVLKQAYYLNLPAPVNLQITRVSGTTSDVMLTWDEVPSATYYAVFTSIVPIGDPPGDFPDEADVKLTQHITTAQTNKRYYFFVVANTKSQKSPHSVNVFIDVV